MRMPFLDSGRKTPLRAAALCPSLLLLACLGAGCATKNPLLEDEAPAAAASAAPATASKSADATTGVHTFQQRRFLGIFSPYRPDIQQGNFVSREMVAQLKEGMTREQVRFVLGTPLLNDIFHADRWDYPFRLVKGNGETIESRVTVIFKDQVLAKLEGGDLPSEENFLSLLNTKPADPTNLPRPRQAVPQQGLPAPSPNRIPRY